MQAPQNARASAHVGCLTTQQHTSFPYAPTVGLEHNSIRIMSRLDAHELRMLDAVAANVVTDSYPL